MNEDQEFFTMKQVAEILDVSESTISRQVQNGEIPTHRVGRSIRISRHDLDAYLKRIREIEYEARPKAKDERREITEKTKKVKAYHGVSKLLQNAGHQSGKDTHRLTLRILDAVIDVVAGPGYARSSRSGTRKKR